MKRLLLLVAMVIGLGNVYAQKDLIRQAGKLKPIQTFDNVLTEVMHSDKHSSSYVIWIKNVVKLHKHEKHSEHVYVLKGKGTMQLGDEKREVRKGDLIFIPEGTPHSLIVESKLMKVLSIHSPQFHGKDRILVQ